MQQRYFAARRDLDRSALLRAYAVLGAQRHAKVLGIFTRKAVRDAMPAYLRHVPRLWPLLERGLSEPALAPVAEWFAPHVPPVRRRVPEIGYIVPLDQSPRTAALPRGRPQTGKDSKTGVGGKR